MINADEVSEESLGVLLKKSQGNVKLIENSNDRNSEQYKDLVTQTIHTLERTSVLVSALRFFSNNETIDDVSTESIKFMLVNAFLASVHQQHFDFTARKTQITLAKAYYKDFHHLCELYGLAQPTEVELNRLANPVNQSNRDAKIQQFRYKKELEEKVAELEKREHDDEELRRAIHLSHVKLWIIRSEEELYNINSELQMLEHMEKIRGGEVKPDPVIKPKVMKPFILVKSELQKVVFGAGYPSLPTMTLEEFYDEELKRVVEEQERKRNEPKPVAPDDPDEETPDSLAKARVWDEFRDTNKRGWGNRHNRS